MQISHKPLDFVNSVSAKVVSITCGRCRSASSRRGGLRFSFDIELFLCRHCVDGMEREVLLDYQRAESLIRGDAA